VKKKKKILKRKRKGRGLRIGIDDLEVKNKRINQVKTWLVKDFKLRNMILTF